MSRIILPAENSGEAKAYIKALTGVSSVVIPDSPSPNDLGSVLKVESKLISSTTSASVGFGYGEVAAENSVRVLLQDYWFLKEVNGTIPEVNSWTFAAGFRVGLCIIGFKADLNVGVSTLAIKAETEGLNVQLQVLRVGMPTGPAVPINLAVPVSLDVEKFGELKAWESSVIQYVDEHRSELSPVLVSASININGQKMLTDVPGIRYALWRIVDKVPLKRAVQLLAEKKVADISEGEVRSIYSTVFGDTTMLIPGQNAENKIPGKYEIDTADGWLTKYKKM